MSSTAQRHYFSWQVTWHSTETALCDCRLQSDCHYSGLPSVCDLHVLVRRIAVNMICTFHQTLEWSNEGGWYRMAGGILHEWAEEKCKQDFGGEPEGMRPLGRLRDRWMYNIKVDLNGTGWDVWTGLIWLRIGAVYRKMPVNIVFSLVCYFKMTIPI